MTTVLRSHLRVQSKVKAKAVNITYKRLGKKTSRLKYGCVDIPSNMPTPIPMKLNPVICSLKLCTVIKMTGNASNVRYRIPKTSALLTRNDIGEYIDIHEVIKRTKYLIGEPYDL